MSDTIDPTTYRSVMGRFATGVTIVTAIDDGEPVGFTAQSFTPLSIDPPLISLSVQKTSTTWPRIRNAGTLCVNILGADDADLCRAFARSGADKYEGVEWTPAPVTGSPLLSGVLAWVDATIEAEHDAGDHTIAVARVDALDAGSDTGPLLFYKAAFGRFEEM